ncbi:MAG TPA: HD-GYP domain-containing protein [Anaerolineae bacterium]|nr:HD-GYP domain-containing protein [Anaerolineae bacterium]
MNDITVRARIFFYSTYAAALAVLVASLLMKPVLPWVEVALFALLIFVADSFTIQLPKNAFISVSFAIIFATSLLLGPEAAAIASIVTIINVSDIKHKVAWYKMLFNACNYAISAYVAGYIFVLAGGTVGGVTAGDFPFIIVPVLLSSTIFFLTNTGLIALGLGFLHEESPMGIWRFDYQWLIPNYYALGVLGLILAQIYDSFGLVSIILLVVPLLIARKTFQVYMELRNAYMGTVSALVQALEAKDPYTRGHSERVAEYAEAIAREIKLPEEKVEILRYAALLHDIGKIGIARKVLNKPGKLTNDEFKRIQAHPRIGAGIIGHIEFLEAAVPAVYYHHEYLNGRGYTEGLSGDRIPLLARIMTVADSFDAMTSTRPYRPALNIEEAAAELRACCGSQFDGRIVEAFVKAMDISLEENNPIQEEMQLEIASEDPA